jgi:Branched-chain amino acid aminotransferase/4-amino-4-deoxychorismate lyase
LENPVPADLKLIETFGWHPGEGIRRRARHIARLARGAAQLGYPLDKTALTAALAALSGASPLRVRLTLDAKGAIEITSAPLTPTTAWRVHISNVTLDSQDPILRLKTTARAPYDAARAALPDGIDEAILLNERGEICEGTITNLFLKRGGIYLTPPLACGLLPGILREELLETGAAREALLRPEDLAQGEIFMGNSLRGLIPARA